jgi:hypothetical protein
MLYGTKLYSLYMQFTRIWHIYCTMQIVQFVYAVYTNLIHLLYSTNRTVCVCNLYKNTTKGHMILLIGNIIVIIQI